MTKEFETRSLLAAVVQMGVAPSFIRDRYFSNVEELPTQKVEFDKVVKGTKLAPIVSKKIQGKIVDKGQVQNFVYETPLLAPETPIDEADMNHRRAGQTVYTNQNLATVEQQIAGEILADHEDMITRREELMCASAISTGKVEVSGEGVDYDVDFWPATNKPYKLLTGGSLWTASTADILGDLRAAKEKVRVSGVIADDLVLGASAANAFLANEKVQALLDNRNFGVGSIDINTLPSGVEYLGKFAGLNVFAYTDTYTDDAGNAQYYLNPKYAVIASTRAKTVLAYGMNRVKSNGDVINVVGRRAPFGYIGDGRDTNRYIGVKAAPLPVNGAPNNFYVLEVVA